MADKRKIAELTKVVNDFTRPSPMKIPKKNPTLNYRYIRNTPENINMMEAKGYTVANGETVRNAGLKPREDGSYRVGDLILATEEYKHHSEHKRREAELDKAKKDAMLRGTRRQVRTGGFNFEETIKQEEVGGL